MEQPENVDAKKTDTKSSTAIKYGMKFYKGETSAGKMDGIGILFDKNQNQFIVGCWKENRLIDLHNSQFILDQAKDYCQIKKFNEKYLLNCLKDDIILKVDINIENLDVQKSFNMIFKDISNGVKIEECLEDSSSDAIECYIEKCGVNWSNFNWTPSHINYEEPHKFLSFGYILSNAIEREASTIEILEIMYNKSKVMNNNKECFRYLNRIRYYPFAKNVALKFDLTQKLMDSLQKASNHYKTWLTRESDPKFTEYLDMMDQLSIFLVRKYDIDILKTAFTMSELYKVPLSLSEAFNERQLEQLKYKFEIIPIVLPCFPHLIRAMGELVSELSQEINAPYEMLLGKFLSKNANDLFLNKLNSKVLSIQIMFLMELIEYYKPGHVRNTNYSHIKKNDFFSRRVHGIQKEPLDLLDVALQFIYDYILDEHPEHSKELKSLIDITFCSFLEKHSSNSYNHWFSLGQHYRKIMVKIAEHSVLLKNVTKLSQLESFLKIKYLFEYLPEESLKMIKQLNIILECDMKAIIMVENTKEDTESSLF